MCIPRSINKHSCMSTSPSIYDIRTCILHIAHTHTHTHTHTHLHSGCYLGIYALLSVGQVISVLVASFTLAIAGLYASQSLHSRMLKNILRSPMSFFDTTPLGRVLNRFSKDIYLVDEVVPKSIRTFFFTGFRIFSTILVIVIATPTFAIVIVPLSIFYSLCQVMIDRLDLDYQCTIRGV